MRNNPQEHRFQLNKVAGLKINRNRMHEAIQNVQEEDRLRQEQQIRKAIMHKDMGRQIWMQRWH